MKAPEETVPRPEPLRSYIAQSYPSVDFQCEPYSYDHLPSPTHIRILRLAPGEQLSPLCCTLESVDLGDRPYYLALSYAWGDADDLMKMKCGDKEIAITRNLYEALDKFRHPRSEAVLWADAVCIDQKDLAERAAQVQLMARIYSEADRVLLWLGRQYQDLVDAALEYLSIFPNYMDHEEKQRRADMYGFRRSYTELSERTKRGLLALYSCPVFQRGWVIQEVALAKSVSVCWGYSRFDIGALVRVVNENQVTMAKLARESRMGAAYNSLLSMCRIRTQQQAGVIFHPLQLISRIRSFLFSDERDRIYGILALRVSASEEVDKRLFVEPEYTVDTENAFKKFTEACLIRSGDLSTLLYVPGGMNSPSRERPSWAPRWDLLDGNWSTLRETYTCGSEHFEISKHTGADREYVSIRGISVAKIECILERHAELDSDEQLQAVLRRLLNSFDVTHVAETALALFPWKHPLEQLSERSGTDRSTLRALCCKQFADRDLAKNPLPKFVPPRVEEDELGDFFGVLYREWMNSRAFFRTSHGVLGVGPVNFQVGDEVVVLFGGLGPNLSFILRPAAEYWRLIGPCYVYAFADGSAVGRWKEKGGVAETFNIW